MSYKDERNPLLGHTSPTLRASFSGSISVSSSGKKIVKNSPSINSMNFSASVNGTRANNNRLTNNSSHNGNFKIKHHYTSGNTPPHDNNNNNNNNKEFSSFDDLTKAPLGSMKLISNEILVTKNVYPTNTSMVNLKIFPVAINNKIFVIILEYLDINDRMKLLLTKKDLSEWREYINIQKKQENSVTNEASDTPIIYYQYDTATLLHETFHKYDKKKNTSTKSIKTLKNSSTVTVDIESNLPLNPNGSSGLSYYISLILNNRSLLYTFISGLSFLLTISIITIIHAYFHTTISKIVMILLLLLVFGGFSIVIINIRMFIL